MRSALPLRRQPCGAALSLAAASLIGLTGCGRSGSQLVGLPVAAEFEVVHSAGEGFSPLTRPVDIDVLPDGQVVVADAGEVTVLLFDSLGRPEGRFGRRGSGPGEFPDITAVLPIPDAILVHEGSNRAIQAFSPDGRSLGRSPYSWTADSYGTLGGTEIVTAADPSWSRPQRAGDPKAPLLVVRGFDGKEVRAIGAHDARGTPYAQHVRNFLLLAGTRPGGRIWFAALNDARVGYFDEGSGRLVVWQRPAPFRGRQIPLDYVPERHFRRRGGVPIPPFDPVTLGVAADTLGRFYMLTAMGSVDNAEGEPARVAVDIATSEDTLISRTILPARGTHLAVSPSGSLIYVLDARAGAITVLRRTLRG